jgi:hypothetical protein
MSPVGWRRGQEWKIKEEEKSIVRQNKKDKC